MIDEVYLVMCQTRSWGSGEERIEHDVIGTFRSRERADAEARLENQRETCRRFTHPATTFHEHFWVEPQDLID